MTPKIALEEHFIHPDFVEYLNTTKANINPALFGLASDALSDFGDRRLEMMERNGIEKAVLSLAGPGVQIERYVDVATRRAREINDFLANEMAKQPDRYGGFAHLALQDPRAAADELERCINDLGMQGALINGQTRGAYMDEDVFAPFWERVSDLKVPVYIHPNNPPVVSHMFYGHPELYGPLWSWTVETATHALRLIFSGTFDRYPGARLILGHMGETLPFILWRLNSRWAVANPGEFKLEHEPSEYFKRNVWITTSGVCADMPLRCSLDALGEDKVMFAADYPFEKPEEATEWIEAAPISHAERAKVCHENARALLGL